MSDQSMVERVARVVVRARGCDDPDTAMSKTGFPCPFCRWDADAKEESGCIFWAEQIIAAMREPTEAMVNAGDEATWEPSSDRPYIGYYGIKNAWQTMIDAALKP